jgi:hypothetical protein
MVHEEGFRRLKIIVRTVTTVGLGLMGLSAALNLLSMFLSGVTRGTSPLGIFFLLGLYLFALGGFLWAAVWVAEGFVRGPKTL